MLTTDFNIVKNLRDFFNIWSTDTCSGGVSCLSNIIIDKPSCLNEISDLDDINDLVGYYYLSGQMIPELESATHLYRNDLFLVSQARSVNRGQSELSSSRKIKNDDLSTKVFYDILAALKLKSMAYREKRHYAISSHNHNRSYNNVRVKINPIYDRTSRRYVGDDKTVNLGDVMVSSEYLSCDHPNKYMSTECNPAHKSLSMQTYTFRSPRYNIQLPPPPIIGTLRFIGQPTIQSLIDHNSLIMTDDGFQVNPYDASGKIRSDYDGWVFPNGTVIKNRNNQLSDASYMYNGDYSSDIVIPVVSNFIKFNPYLVNGVNLQVQPSTLGLKQHIHAVDECVFNGNITLDRDQTKIYITDLSEGAVNVHKGNVDKPKAVIDTIEANFKLYLNTAKFTNLKTKFCEQIGDEPVPEHFLLPVMVYIGGVTREYFENIS